MFRFACFLVLSLTGLVSHAQLPETDWLPETDAAEASVEDGQLLLEETAWEQRGQLRWHNANRQERLQLPGMTEDLLLAIETHEQYFGVILDFEEFQQIEGLSPELLRIWRPLLRMEPNFKFKIVPEKEGKHHCFGEAGEFWKTNKVTTLCVPLKEEVITLAHPGTNFYAIATMATRFKWPWYWNAIRAKFPGI